MSINRGDKVVAIAQIVYGEALIPSGTVGTVSDYDEANLAGGHFEVYWVNGETTPARLNVNTVELVESTSINLSDEDLQALHDRIANEGFSYCFLCYSHFNEIADKQFHRLRKEYIASHKALEKYLKYGEFAE
jgi:hypothetical protein